MTGCGCLLLIGALVGLIVLLIFGSTDSGEPIETAVALFALLWSGKRQAFVPRRHVLVGTRDA
ncbi:MAG: hypothetical protein E6I44_07220 [Chloroflexi bacterium]|nr:MAG: hypothetical protein E6I44_07220 [Chloroflexota bacterium]